MRKRDVLRLRPGMRVSYGHGTTMAAIRASGGERQGRVVRVTERGGVLIEPQEGGAASWHAYSHLIEAWAG